MRISILVFLAGLVLSAARPGSASPEVFADEFAGASAGYVDLDGDGIDDALVDFDGDGIPDALSAPREEPAAAESGIFASSSHEAFAAPVEVKGSRCSQAFAERLSTHRGLALHRGGFDSGEGFGPGNGISLGSGSGGHCAGGICF